MDPAIPTAAQVRAMPVTSVKALRKALVKSGLRIKQGGVHLRVETATGAFVWTVPLTPSCPHALLNCRTRIAHRVAELANDNNPNGRTKP